VCVRSHASLVILESVYDVVLFMSYLLKDMGNDNFTILDYGPLFIGESFLAEGITRTKSIEVLQPLLEQSEVIIFLTGYFSKDTQGLIIIPFNHAFIFDFKENIYKSGLELEYDKLKRKLNINYQLK